MTFDFTIDAFPGYTRFAQTGAEKKKVLFALQVIGSGSEDTNHPYNTATISGHNTWDKDGLIKEKKAQVEGASEPDTPSKDSADSDAAEQPEGTTEQPEGTTEQPEGTTDEPTGQSEETGKSVAESNDTTTSGTKTTTKSTKTQESDTTTEQFIKKCRLVRHFFYNQILTLK